MFDTSKACNWNKLARLPKHAFLKDRYWKKMFLCILCCALHVNVHLWISVNTHAEDKELVSFSMALYLLSLKQSIIELEVQCFSQTDRSASSQDLPVFAHPPAMLGLYICAAMTGLGLFKMWVLGMWTPAFQHSYPLSHYPNPENILKSYSWQSIFVQKIKILRIKNFHWKFI